MLKEAFFAFSASREPKMDRLRPARMLSEHSFERRTPTVLLGGKLSRQWRELAARVEQEEEVESLGEYGVYSSEMQGMSGK